MTSHTRTEVGDNAPDFTLSTTSDQSVTLSKLRGKPVVLVFYPADWSPVCGDQVSLYNEMLSVFNEYDAQLLGISVDGVWSHAAFGSQRNYQFPLWSDFEPKGRVARLYGVYNEADGLSKRALFVIDANGVIRWSYLSPDAVNPGADGILTALEDLAGGRS
jgi:peroxiredoxin